MHLDTDAFERTLRRARARLLDCRAPAGHWVGELSGSALATATAAFALHLIDAHRHRSLIDRGLAWLAENRNGDGGWGDTVASRSNLAATMLCLSALVAADSGESYRGAVAAAESWLRREAGGLDARTLAGALAVRYGRDRSFSVPILTMCALAGMLGQDRRAWTLVPPLPFELAAVPHRWLKWLRLPVVSYALPALIAIGQARYHHRPPANPLTRLARRLTRARTLRLLAEIQPAGGGFLEAAPLTAFVVMSLAAAGRPDHPVVGRGVEFLRRSARPDGSWPIDANLSTWVTTLSVNALAAGPGFAESLPPGQRGAVRDWLLDQQFRTEHPYTRAAPGGWAWTDLPGGVPDADDTAGALLALANLAPRDPRVSAAAAGGVRWLLGLQNRDGGIPTFCRGWGVLDFDRSSPDLTAHALRAWAAWRDELPRRLRQSVQRASSSAAAYLERVQRPDGSWVPLWFGSESAAGEENPTYGTAKVIVAEAAPAGRRARGVDWLVSARNGDGGWGGAPGAPSSIEETALAVAALAGVLSEPRSHRRRLEPAVADGVAWLMEHTAEGRSTEPAPIGLYFARLWYFEQLYPLIFTVSALGAVARLLRSASSC